jgi:hypothetical protein
MSSHVARAKAQIKRQDDPPRWQPGAAEQRPAVGTALDLGEWDAGEDDAPIPPREWLLGNVFCRGFVSSLISGGAGGKTTLRYAQVLSLTSGRELTGEHVFRRCRALVVSLEDGRDEARRRMRAARLYHEVSADEVRGYLYQAAPPMSLGRLIAMDPKTREFTVSTLAMALERTIVARKIDLLIIDPLIKTHNATENDNNAMDLVIQVLTDMALKHNIAVDIPQHKRKGTSEPGDAESGRGASAVKDGARLVKTLTGMTSQEAQSFNVPERDRKRYIRVDDAKVNISPASGEAQWFRLVGVALNNGTDAYPSGDNVQTLEPWQPPQTWAGLSDETLNRVLDEITKGLPDGNRYAKTGGGSREAWHVVAKHMPDKSDKQCREIINTWFKTGLLYQEPYTNPVTRKNVYGLHVDDAKRPGTDSDCPF